MLNTQCGIQGGYLAGKRPGEGRRLAVMHASMQLLEQLVEYRPLLDALRFGNVVNPTNVPEWGPWADKMRRALLLPDNCRIDAISPTYLFVQNQISFRLECDDFREVPECGTVPEVEATYCCTEDLLHKQVCHFAGWNNEAALIDEDYVPPPKPDTSRCSEELGHFPKVAAPVGVAAPMMFGGLMATWQAEAVDQCWCGAVVRDGSRWVLKEPTYKFGPQKHTRCLPKASVDMTFKEMIGPTAAWTPETDGELDAIAERFRQQYQGPREDAV